MSENTVVIGMGCRLPGAATSPNKLWEMMCRKESGWGPITRFNHQGFYHPDPRRQGAIPIKGAHFLTQDPAEFDASFFAVPAAAARSMDPQQALLLEVTYEALENAGITLDHVKGSRTSVFIASFVKDYEAVSLRDIDSQPDLAATGNGTAILANRISYFFDLKGPSVTIDTACSGSLVAIDLAIQSLKSGSSDMAIVGGVNMMLVPDTMIPMASMGFLSSEGKCFAFDSRASGYGRGEGAGIVILKRLPDALANNDPIRAEVVGHGVNQDGRTSGITMPHPVSQLSNITQVYSRGHLRYSDTAYVECHGTGTIVGDKTEMTAISAAICSHRPSSLPPVYIGSVKTHIGHLEGAAGVAGFIKAVLSVEKGKIPPNINFENPRSDVNAEELGLKIPLEVTDWPAGYSRRQASVNSFGFGGTNAHAVIADADALRLLTCHTMEVDSSQPNIVPFVLSAHDSTSLKLMVDRLVEYVISTTKAKTPIAPRQLAYTLSARRSQLATRIAISSSCLLGLISKLKEVQSNHFTTVPAATPRVCFVFAGQGGVWPQMAMNLMSFPVFKASISAASLFLRKTYSWPHTVEELIEAPKATSRITDVDVAQVVTTVVQVASIDLLRDLGIIATAVIGHSSGEIAAAYAACKISQTFAWTCAFQRGLFVQYLMLTWPQVAGGMVSVGLGALEARKLLDSLPFDRSRIQVACENSPRSVTISGRISEITQLVSVLVSQNIFHRVLQIPVGYHSPDMELIVDSYINGLTEHMEASTGFSAEDVAKAPRMYSTLLGDALDKKPLPVHYWGLNLSEKVLFSAGMNKVMCHEDAPTIFLEVGTGGGMRAPVLDCVKTVGGRSAKYFSLIDMKQPSELSVIQKLGDLWAHGVPVAMDRVVRRQFPNERLPCVTDLPSYPWNHETKYWVEPSMSTAHLNRRWPRRDLIGSRTLDSSEFEVKWRGFHRLGENPWIKEHKVQGSILYPAAGMIAMALEAASELAVTQNMADVSAYEIQNFEIHQAMIVPSNNFGLESSISMKLDVAQECYGRRWHFTIYSRLHSGSTKRNASGTVFIHTQSPEFTAFQQTQRSRLLSLSRLCTKTASTIELYECLEAIGLQYGRSFRNITSIKRSPSDPTASHVSLHVPDTASTMPYNFEFPHIIHPATLDSMLHSLFTPSSDPMVPVGIGRIVVSADLRGGTPGAEFHGFGKITHQSLRETTGDVVMAGSSDIPQVILQNVRLATLQLPPGWLSQHRNLASEIVWTRDIATFRSGELNIEDVIKGLTAKKLHLQVLVIDWAPNDVPALLQLLQTSNAQPTITVQNRPINSTLTEEKLLKDSGMDFTVVETLDSTTLFDLIYICYQDGIDIANLQSRIASHGAIILPAPLDFEEKYLASDHGLVDCSRIFAVQAFGHAMTFLGAPKATFPNSITILLPTHTPPSVLSLARSIKCLLLSSNPNVVIKMVEITRVSGTTIQNAFCISLMHLSSSLQAWNSTLNISIIKRICSLSIGLLFVSQPCLRNGMFGAGMTGLVRTLVSEGNQIPLGVLRLSTSAKLESQLIANTIAETMRELFIKRQVNDIEYEERNGDLYIPRLRLAQILNAEIDPSLYKPINTLFSSDTALLSLKKMAGAPNPLAWLPVPPSLPSSTHLLIQRTSMSLTHRDIPSLINSSTSTPLVGSDFFGIVNNMPVVGLMVPQPVRSAVYVDAQLVRQVPIGHGAFSLSAYVAAAAALVDARPIVEYMEDVSVESLSRKVHVGRTVLVVGAGTLEGAQAVRVAMNLGYSISAIVGSMDDVKEVIREGVLPGNVLIAGDRFEFENRFDVIFMAALYDISQIKCRTLFTIIDGPITSRATTQHHWNLQTLLQEEIPLLAQLIDLVQALIINGRLSISRAPFIFETDSMQEAVKHLQASPEAHVMVTFPTDLRVSVVPASPFAELSSVISSTALYVLVGAPRGLAGSIASHLANNGARHLAFLSRSAGACASEPLVDFLSSRGVSVQLISVDITSLAAVSQAASLLQTHPGGISGMIQCAGLLRDGMFDSVSQANWDAVVHPKVRGSQALVASFSAGLSADKMPWMLFLSSAAGIVGNRGQSNYAAANTWVDAFTGELREAGLRASSLAFGPVMGPGMIARDPSVMRLLKSSGFFGIRECDFLKAISMAVVSMASFKTVQFPVTTAFGLGTGGLLKQMQTVDPYWRDTAIYTHLASVDLPVKAGETVSATETLPAEPADYTTIDGVVSALSGALAERLEMAPENIDAERSMLAYGLDSFSGFWLRKWVEERIGVSVPVFEIIGDISVVCLAKNVIKRLAAMQMT